MTYRLIKFLYYTGQFSLFTIGCDRSRSLLPTLKSKALPDLLNSLRQLTEARDPFASKRTRCLFTRFKADYIDLLGTYRLL